jgi:hypothetical protein
MEVIMRWMLWMTCVLVACNVAAAAEQACVGGVCRLPRRSTVGEPGASRAAKPQPRRLLVRGTRQR